MLRPRFAILSIILTIAAVGCAPASTSTTSPSPTGAVTPFPPVTMDVGTFLPSPPAGALPRSAAMAAALKYAPGATSATQVIEAYIEPDPWPDRVRPSGSTTSPELAGRVWVVLLFGGGLTGAPCGTQPTPIPAQSSARPCLDAVSGIAVVLDLVTGDLLGWMH